MHYWKRISIPIHSPPPPVGGNHSLHNLSLCPPRQLLPSGWAVWGGGGRGERRDVNSVLPLQVVASLPWNEGMRADIDTTQPWVQVSLMWCVTLDAPFASSLVILIHFHGLYDSLHANSSQTSISSPDLSPELQVHLSTAWGTSLCAHRQPRLSTSQNGLTSFLLNHSFIHPSNQSSIHPSSHPSIHPLIHPPIHSSNHSFWLITFYLVSSFCDVFFPLTLLTSLLVLFVCLFCFFSFLSSILRLWYFHISIETIFFSLPFILLMWWFTLTDFQMLTLPSIPGIKPTQSWCIFFFIYFWIWFADVLLRIFISIFRNNIALKFSSLVKSLSDLDFKVLLAA